jgi:hypothetical protein
MARDQFSSGVILNIVNVRNKIFWAYIIISFWFDKLSIIIR